VWLKKQQQQQQQQKAKHRAGACRSKVYVYYDELKVIFFDVSGWARTQALRL
jgi:hypothetical protein